MTPARTQKQTSRSRLEIFLSYSGKARFEASLLQFAIEQILMDLEVCVWTYERDQEKSERQIGKSLKERVQGSAAVIFLASPSTFSSGAAQWMARLRRRLRGPDFRPAPPDDFQDAETAALLRYSHCIEGGCI